MLSTQWTSFFVGVALKSVVVLGLAWILSTLLRKRSAASRHLVWTAASAALLALPFLSISLPSLAVDLAPAVAPPNVAFQATASSHADRSATTAASPSNAVVAHPTTSSKMDWRTMIVLLWTIGAAISLLRMFMAWTAIWRVRRASLKLTASEIDAAKESLGIAGHIDVLETGPGVMPMSFGFLRPAILLPADANQWSEERRRVVLLHELAHVQRGDFATHVMARAAFSLYWWNPLAWIAWREFLKERERAADDLVLRAGAPAAEYADHLLDIARTMQSSPNGEWATVAIARRSQLEGRLLAILDSSINRKGARRLSAAVAALAAIAVVAPLAAVRAQDADQKTTANVDALIRSANAQVNHEILDTAAQVAEDSGDYSVARKLLDSALAIREKASGNDSLDYGEGLAKLGDLESHQGHAAQAKTFYTQSAAVLGNHPEAGPVLMHLGTAAVVDKQLDAAYADFERAKLAAPTRAGEALTWMAIVRNKQGSADEAEKLFSQALSVVDRTSVDASNIMRVYAAFLEEQGRNQEATPLREEAASIRKAQSAKAIATAKARAAAGVYRVGGAVTAPKLVSKVEPQYSDEARAAKLAGTEVVYAEIGPDGLAHNVAVTVGLGFGLDEKGVEAVKLWRFTPATKDGQPVTVAVNIEINFKLL